MWFGKTAVGLIGECFVLRLGGGMGGNGRLPLKTGSLCKSEPVFVVFWDNGVILFIRTPTIPLVFQSIETEMDY